MPQTLDQRRAQFAWTEAQKGVQTAHKEYVNMVKGASSFIMSNGLMQALAFYESRKSKKNKNQASLLCDSICSWLKNSRIVNTEAAFDSTMKALFNSDSPTYMRATEETLAMLRWLRQFADALKDKAEGVGSSGK